MFHRRGDNLTAPALRLNGGEQRGVVRFGAAGGPNDFMIEFGPEQRLHPLARGLQRPTHRRAEAVHRRGVAEMLGEQRDHRLHHRRINPRGGIVVEIYGAHGLLSPQ